MKVKKFIAMGVMGVAMVFAMSNSASAATKVTDDGAKPAGICAPTAQDQSEFGRYTDANGNTKEGQCFTALVTGNDYFDKMVDRAVRDKTVIAMFGKMSEEAKTSPEFKDLQSTYRSIRAEFVQNTFNDIKESTGEDYSKLSTKNEKVKINNNVAETVNTFTLANGFDTNIMKRIRDELVPKAKTANKSSLGM